MASRVGGVDGIGKSFASLQIDDQRKGGKKDELTSPVHAFPPDRTRPQHIASKLGLEGEPVTCLTNYISVNSAADWLLYQYQIEFSPPIDSKVMRIKMLRSQSEKVGMEDLIFDGDILFLPFRMPNRTLTCTHPSTNQPVQMKAEVVAELASNSPESIAVFNLCIRRALQYLDFTRCPTHFYNPNKAVIVQKHKLEIWPGIISAIRVHEDQLLLCCEMSHKLLHTQSVLDVIERVRGEVPAERHVERCNQLLLGKSVLARYSNKTYRIDGIDWDKSPLDRFEGKDGLVRFLDYYAAQHNTSIKNHTQPLLVSRVKRRGLPVKGKELPEVVYLVPELCSMTGLTDQMRSEREVMRALEPVYTSVPPVERVKHVQTFASAINSKDTISGMMRTWSLGFGTDAVRVKARVLPQEAILLSPHREPKDQTPMDTVLKYSDLKREWALGKKIAEPKNLLNWVLVYLPTDKEKENEKVDAFIKCIRTIGRQIGMQIDEPYRAPVSSTHHQMYVEAIKAAVKKAESKPEMVVSMVPNDNKTRYDEIKKRCLLVDGVPSQVVRSQSLAKDLMSVCGKIILQMNCKLGGSLWRVPIPLTFPMVIGYDSYLDPSEGGKSACAVVLSLNPEITRWYSQCALHTDTESLIENLKLFFKNGLTKFHKVNRQLPKRIFVYRSITGDCQIPVVFNYELPQVQQVIAEVGEKLMLFRYKPQLSFITVNKRINTRLFLEKSDGVENPRPGTVVDTVVTRPERYDFYLVPQRMDRGTVTPVSYNVILDNNGLTPNHMQRLAFKLCHLYYNWQGTVRIPAPCLYAQKLASLVAQSLHQQAKEELRDKLYFI